MKVAVVVQRYGADVNGGAELHARYIAEHLARHVDVEVLTTCAKDYVSWRNEWPAGTEQVQGVSVRRFPVAHERDPHEFGTWSGRVFGAMHSVKDELAWLDAEGPTSPALVSFIREHEAAYDFFIFFSFRYYHAFHGARAVPGKAILVPTAERDDALGLGIFAPVFRGVRALMYNSHEERALIHTVARNEAVPGVVVGVGSEIPDYTSAGRFRQKYGIRDRFAIYVGRIDENKGCKELFAYFEHYASAFVDSLHLVLVGNPIIPVPDHPRIHHLGFLSDEDKFDALAAAELLVMPSYFESLSMVALEAWALGKPVLANAKCDVLQGQCIRSNGGLFYESFKEFFETLRALDSNPSLAATLGRNGRAYFERHYSWPIVEKHYTDMLDRLTREPATHTMEPMPGWWSSRRRLLRPAHAVVQALPTGPVSRAEEQRQKAEELKRKADERRVRVEQAEARTPTRAIAVADTSQPVAGWQQTADGRWERQPDAAPAVATPVAAPAPRASRGPADPRRSRGSGAHPNRTPSPARTAPSDRAPRQAPDAAAGAPPAGQDDGGATRSRSGGRGASDTRRRQRSRRPPSGTQH